VCISDFMQVFTAVRLPFEMIILSNVCAYASLVMYLPFPVVPLALCCDLCHPHCHSLYHLPTTFMSRNGAVFEAQLRFPVLACLLIVINSTNSVRRNMLRPMSNGELKKSMKRPSTLDLKYRDSPGMPFLIVLLSHYVNSIFLLCWNVFVFSSSTGLIICDLHWNSPVILFLYSIEISIN
jgi:hypothetical protein